MSYTELPEPFADADIELVASGGVATLWLQRAHHGNRLHRKLIRALHDALRQADEAAEVRVIVLAGRGPDFCLGHDPADGRSEADPRVRRADCLAANDVMLALSASSKPTLARIQGRCAGAGLELVAACTLAVASTSASFAAPGATAGAWPHSTQVALSRNLPRKLAMAMLLTNKVVSAEAMAACGFINEVVPDAALDRAVDRLARNIVALAPDMVGLGLHGFNHQATMNPADAYDFVTDQLYRELEATARRSSPRRGPLETE
jgi:enoyl-CoA hydratase/carnithine racemase